MKAEHDLTTQSEALSKPSPVEQDWEVVIGTSWLNKLGVLVFVIGVALLVGYSMTRLGPGGRVAVGFALSGIMLGAGVMAERRERYRTFGYGLIAGGWAGVYFTTFAMHGIASAKVLDGDLTSIALLFLVAVGMIAHSLRYRSEAMTTLAYVVAYATLLLSPLTWFAAFAAVPLAASVVIVAARFGWSSATMLVAVLTYALFPLRHTLGWLDFVDPRSLAPYFTIGLFWLTFEAADLMAIRRTTPTDKLNLSSFVLNAIGALGVTLFEVPIDDPRFFAGVLFACGGVALASAVVRVRVLQSCGRVAIGDTPPTSVHVAIGLATALTAIAAAIRFNEPRTLLVLLLETELLLASAVMTRDRLLKAFALGAAAITSLCALYMVGLISQGRIDTAGWPALVGLVAAAWYANREWIQAHSEAHVVDRGFSWMAAFLVVALIIAEVTPVRGGLICLLFAAGLLEVGLLDREEYRSQAYMIAAGGGAWIVLVFMGSIVSTHDMWMVLPAAIAIVGAASLQLALIGGRDEYRDASRAGAFLTLALTMLFEEQVLTTFACAVAWALTGTTLVIVGAKGRSALLRTLGYALSVLGAARTVDLTTSQVPLPYDVVWAGVTIAALFIVFLVTRQRAAASDETAVANDEAVLETRVRQAIAGFATVLLFVLVMERAHDSPVTVIWGASAITLVVAGLAVSERTLRVCGLSGLFACVVRVFLHDLPELDTLGRISACVVLGLVMIGASWIYTRYRERVQRLW